MGELVDQQPVDAGIVAFNPHDLRRSYISGLLDANVDLATTQKLAGHSRPTVTAVYDRRPFRTLASAVSRLDMPH